MGRKPGDRATGTVKLSSLGRLRATLARGSSCDSNPADLGPHPKRTPPCSSMPAGGDVGAAEMEEVVHLGVGGEKTLCLLRRLEALHLPFSPSRRLVRVPRPIIELLVPAGAAP